MAPGKEVNLPGLVSNCLLIKRGTMQLFCKRTSTIAETRAVFGRKRQQPRKLGACARRGGNLWGMVCSEGMHEMPSAMTFVFVSTRPKG
jgi:hypothetical protein